MNIIKNEFNTTVIFEEHISFVQQPVSIYMEYVVPNDGLAKIIETTIFYQLKKRNQCKYWQICRCYNSAEKGKSTVNNCIVKNFSALERWPTNQYLGKIVSALLSGVLQNIYIINLHTNYLISVGYTPFVDYNREYIGKFAVRVYCSTLKINHKHNCVIQVLVRIVNKVILT